MAIENGLETEDVDDYIAGEGRIPLFPTPFVAAVAKINVEKMELENKVDIIDDWIMYITMECEQTEGMSEAVRAKGRYLKDCIASIIEWSLKNAKPVDPSVLKKCGINYKVTLGIPGAKQARELIRNYYMGGVR